MNVKKIGRLSIVWVILISLFLSSCAEDFLTPQMSYQGRLTNAEGSPLNGDYDLKFSVYNVETGGTSIYNESDTVNVENGIFDTIVGPTTIGGLTPSELSQPLWIEVEVGNGVITETLTPRQRLYGAPYAFTLMAGSVISNTMGYTLFDGSGIGGVVTIQNSYDGDEVFSSDAALPALNVVGETTLQLSSPTGNMAGIYSDVSNTNSDLAIYSNDDLTVFLDDDANTIGSFFYVFGEGSTSNYCAISSFGNLTCTGSITANVRSSIVDADGESRLMYSVESPELWMEDFGASTLTNGSTTVILDPLFAETVNLDEYHVYVTPLGDCQGLYVSNKTATGFEVHELGGGSSDIEFDYRIVAHRVGYDEVRMPVDTSAKSMEADE